jgi:hypothetical protein
MHWNFPICTHVDLHTSKRVEAAAKTHALEGLFDDSIHCAGGAAVCSLVVILMMRKYIV